MEHFGILSVVPPLVAIALCIYTKQVIFSLFLGVVTGLFIYTGANPFATFSETAAIIVRQVIDDWHAHVLVFTFFLGGVVGLAQRGGGLQAFGRWAQGVVRTRKSAQVTTWVGGLVLFFDDYFNILTLGSVMRPITDQHKISREKLAYIVDSTAAPVCTIVPISTWVAYMVSLTYSEFQRAGIEASPFAVFLESIPYNFYAITAILMVLFVALSDKEFGPMLKAERRAMTTGKLFEGGVTELTGQDIQLLEPSEKGTISDMVVPIATLVIVTIIGLLYTGGFFEPGVTLMDAIGDADAAVALVWATLAGCIAGVLWMAGRRVVSMADAFSAMIQGGKAMLPALCILILAWSIGEVTGMLGLGVFVAEATADILSPAVLPLLVFIISGFIAFSTGTSWGTFAIMMPVGMPIAFAIGAPPAAVIAAVFGGGIFGDHCSPISDTTILSSTGSACNHIDHVSTQLPYALVAAGVACIGFLLAGIMGMAFIPLLVTLALMGVVMYLFHKKADAPISPPTEKEM